MNHLPLEPLVAGQFVQRSATALVNAGHEVRVLLLDASGPADDRLQVRRIVCCDGDAKADLPFDVPRFTAESNSSAGPTFPSLTDLQVAEYREKIRRHLDVEVDQFDPHVIHAQHIWVQGQLALETGVPYVLNAWGAELFDYAADARYRAWADQAAENAARILVPDERLREQVVAMFEGVAENTAVMPADLLAPSASASVQAVATLTAIYERARQERFGRLP
ncbi:MAG TPA: glycosyltransferase [Pirellulales bacterium]|nr:glycosyltransferase [Pirellulales bacterium]